MKNSALDDLVIVADEGAARFRAALHGELNALGYGHFGEALEKRLAPGHVGFRRGSGFRESGLVYGIAGPVKFMELILLVDGQRCRMLEGSGERGRFADAIELFHQ